MREGHRKNFDSIESGKDNDDNEGEIKVDR